ncbi:hypothetical protein L218DRAFT_284124 [Marasmius fiardii PR-910]|nr:hypothetical protein L218DRAFT_284124 [Marasmius fiardii PR-910]
MYSPTTSLYSSWSQSRPDRPSSSPISTDRLLDPEVAEDYTMNTRSTSSDSSTALPSMWNEPSPLTDPSPSPTIPIEPVKLEPYSRPTSPHFIIEPLLSSLTVHKSISLHAIPHRRSQSPVTQSELAEQLLISQSLAPPTQVPLRATHASSEMLEMMSSFRLNPFAFHTKHKGVQREDLYLTWCGEEPKPLEEEPCMFEWQLEGYCGGILEDLNLIVMDDASSVTSDNDSPSFHNSSVQLPFPSTTSARTSLISSPDPCHSTSFTTSTFSPGRQGQGTPELLAEQPESAHKVNDPDIEIPDGDSGGARFRLHAASFPSFPGVSWNQSQSDSFYSSSISPSTSSPQSFCNRRSSPADWQTKPHNCTRLTDIRPYPDATERGRSLSYPRSRDLGQQSEALRHREPIEYMLNKPGCGVNASRSVTTPSSWPLARSNKMESRNEAPSQQAHHPMFSLSKVTSAYHDQYQVPGALDYRPSTSAANGTAAIDLPSLPAYLADGNPPKRPSSSPLASWQLPSSELVGDPARAHWTGRQMTSQQQSILCKEYTDGPVHYSTLPLYAQLSSCSPGYGDTDTSVPRGLVFPKAIQPRQSSSSITTIPTAAELYASKQSFDAPLPLHSDSLSREQLDHPVLAAQTSVRAPISKVVTFQRINAPTTTTGATMVWRLDVFRQWPSRIIMEPDSVFDPLKKQLAACRHVSCIQSRLQSTQPLTLHALFKIQDFKPSAFDSGPHPGLGCFFFLDVTIAVSPG